jgi:hypothetical protein
MRFTKYIAIGVMALALALVGCSDVPKGQKLENKQQKAATEQLVANQSIPVAGYSQMRQTLIEIEKAQIAGTATTTFFFNQGVVDPVKMCSSIGTPIPNTASLSNPTQIIKRYDSAVAVDQMDPNGVYIPESSTGTYVLCVNDNGKPYVSYWEGFVQTEYAPAVWDVDKHQIKDTGAPTYRFSKTNK